MVASEFDIGCLHGYCTGRGITIHPYIQPKNVPGCGLGVYATKEIKAGEQLIHIPDSQVFSTANIPDHFLEKSAREGIAVHAQLAAFFAFAKEADLEPYRPWTKTWPVFGDFFSTMPIFWGELIMSELEKQHVDNDQDGSDLEKPRPVSKKQKIQSGPRKSRSCSSTSSKTLASSGEPAWASHKPSLNTVRDQVVQMAKKLVAHTISIHYALPKLRLLNTPEKMTRFFHAWCIINTRCFYYILPTPSRTKHKAAKPKAPADPNEAMGLCPYMDFFNHTAPSPPTDLSSANGSSPQRPCKVRSGANGFTAVTTSDIKADAEILFSYGSHTNDTLWSEYGFLLASSSNTSDSILLDSIILESLSDEQCSVLDDHGYLGAYTLFNDGSVCYRTEMTAWLPILGTQKWTEAVGECLDPADLVDTDMQLAVEGSHSQARQTRSRSTMNARQQHCHVLEGWLKALQEEARKDKVELLSMGTTELLESYKTLSMIEIVPQSQEAIFSQAKMRRRMCIDRCEQIRAMAARGVEAVLADTTSEQ